MNEKEVAEIRRRFRPEKSSINHVRGCYVSEQGEVVSQFDLSLALMPQEEGENLLALLRRTLYWWPGQEPDRSFLFHSSGGGQ